jgi:polyisoprenoid-binding protein YceI
MATRYQLDPSHSRFTVQAFATGLLSFFGHSPTFAVREFDGLLDFGEGQIAGLKLDVTVRADALALVDNVKPTDRAEIEGRMRSEVLETAAYPTIDYHGAVVSSQRLAQGQYGVRVDGALSLHGVTRPHPVDAHLLILDDSVRLRGESLLRLSEHAIRPVTALAGAIKLKDDLKVSFDLAAVPEGP